MRVPPFHNGERFVHAVGSGTELLVPCESPHGLLFLRADPVLGGLDIYEQRGGSLFFAHCTIGTWDGTDGLELRSPADARRIAEAMVRAYNQQMFA